MTGNVHALIALCIQGKAADDYVFTRAHGKRVRDFRKAWRNLCSAAGVPACCFTICGARRPATSAGLAWRRVS